MRHDWRYWTDPAKTPAQVFMDAEQRRCTNCLKVQSLHKSYSWGRVEGRRWLPLAGLCLKPA